MQQLQWLKDLITVKEEDWPEGMARKDTMNFIWILSLCLDPNRLGKLQHFYHLETFANESIHASCQRKVSGFTVFITRELVLDRNLF